MPPLRIRQSVRALIVSPQREIMLVRFQFRTGTVWATPGGGAEPGEEPLDTLHRELAEEVGMAPPAVARHVWNREHLIPFEDGMWDGQQDRFYLVPAERFEAAPALSWEQLRAENLHEIRWWTLDEIDAATAAGTLFAPRRLGSLFRRLLTDGPPDTPLDTGV